MGERYSGLEQITPQCEASWEVTFGIDVLTSLIAIAKKAKEKKVAFRFLGDRKSEKVAEAA